MLKKILCIALFVFLAASMMNSAFATVIFADGFESGNFSKWSGTVRTYSENVLVSWERKHHGLYAGTFTSHEPAIPKYQKAYCYKNIPATSDIYVRGYFYMSLCGMVYSQSRLFFVVLKPVGASGAAYIGLKRNPATGVINWCFNCRSGATYSKADKYSSYLYPQPNHWYCVELHWKRHVTYGYAEAWINGHYIGRTSYRNTAYYGAINQVQFGLPQVYDCASNVVRGDCARISTSYIGPEY